MNPGYLVVVVPKGGAWVETFSAVTVRDAIHAAAAFATAREDLRVTVYGHAVVAGEVLHIADGRWRVPCSHLGVSEAA